MAKTQSASEPKTDTPVEHIFNVLPFVQVGPGGRDFWAPPHRTAEHSTDWALGVGFAETALKLAERSSKPELVGYVLRDIARKGRCDSLELGFINCIGDHAVAMARALAGHGCLSLHKGSL